MVPQYISSPIIHQQLMEGMRDLHLRMHRLMNERLKAEGASLAQLKLLSFIQRSGSVRSIDISDALGHSPRTVTEAVDGLERDGLVLRKPDPTDRRAKWISLTEAGRAVIRAVDPCRLAFTSQIFDALTPADQHDMLRLLEALNRRLIEMGARDAFGEGRDNAGPSGQQQDHPSREST
jgi:DNA-binding MarR family transcriptional regulator